MFTFIIRKMLNNKWMIISLLIGNILLCSLVASIPLYSDAILQRMLIKQLEQQQIETNKYPGTVEIKFNSLSVNRGYELKSLSSFEEKITEMGGKIGVPLTDKVTIYSLNTMRVEPILERDSAVQNRTLQLRYSSELADHITITGGRMYSDTLSDGVIEVIVNEKTLIEQDLLLDEVLIFPTLKMEDDSVIKFKVVGTYINSSNTDSYWVYSPANFSDVCMMSEPLFHNIFIENYSSSFNFSAMWYLLLDYNSFETSNVNQISEVSRDFKSFFDQYGTNACRLNYMDTLDGFSEEASRLNITLWVLQVPILILLAFFIFMVSKQILEQEKNSIAVLKSRGAGRSQIIFMFVIQSLIISAASYIIGIPLGAVICRVLGSANGFLNLVARSALNVKLNSASLIYTAAAALLSVMTMVIPAINYSKVTIVDHKRSKTAKNHGPIWQRFFLDILLFGVSLYGLYSFNNQKDFLSSDTAASLDPLLFISSSLFIIGAGLIFMRAFPLLVKLVFRVGKKYWSPSLYASFLKVTRSLGEEQFIMIFLILTVATGIFNAKAARTINLNMEDNIRYTYGADLVVMEQWNDNSANEDAEQTIYFEPDFEKYTDFGSTVNITKVLNSPRNTVGSMKNIRLMGINTKEFGQTAWFRNGLLPTHINNYLNTMSTNARAVIVSMNFHTTGGYQLGDIINVRNNNGSFFSGVICGFVDFWPTYFPTTTTTSFDGTKVVKDEWLVIANLAQVQSVWGVTPYELWMKTDESMFIYDFAEEHDLKFTTFRDSDATIVAEKNNPVLQGTNGVLTVGFIIVLLVCMTGFLIYWILSIRSRVLQFGIFRAMGMSMKNILALLVNEQVFISGVSVAVGALIGYIGSDLFVPLIQLGYSSSVNSLPLKVIAEGGDYIKLFSIIGLMFVVCMIILGTIISKIKIAQALKLGED